MTATPRSFTDSVGDPQVADLATPINDSGLVNALVENLPAYRRGLSPFRRGLEVGMAHGYWLIGPFAKLGPLRDTDVANLAGLLATVGLVVILTLCLSLYGASNPPNPTETETTPQPPATLRTTEDWNEFGSGFLIGGVGGGAFAYFVLANLELLQGIATSR